MKGRTVLVTAAAAFALLAFPHAKLAQTVQPCADPNSCARVGVSVDPQTGKSGDVVTAHLTFQQGPGTAGSGGIDKVAALAMTLTLGSSATPALTLGNSCALDGNGFPTAVTPSGALAGYKVVIENASCANGRTHCLCPDGSQARDNFVNIVVYGPDPLPTPGPNGIDIPTLPSGELLTIALKVEAGASGEVPLHVLNESADAGTRPQFTALLSVGDKTAVDQTCAPLAVPGTPPCAAAGSASQVAITDATLTVTGGLACVGDCNSGNTVTVDEILTMVNIAITSGSTAACPAGDPNHSNTITVDEILTAVNNALTHCPT